MPGRLFLFCILTSSACGARGPSPGPGTIGAVAQGRSATVSAPARPARGDGDHGPPVRRGVRPPERLHRGARHQRFDSVGAGAERGGRWPDVLESRGGTLERTRPPCSAACASASCSSGCAAGTPLRLPNRVHDPGIHPAPPRARRSPGYPVRPTPDLVRRAPDRERRNAPLGVGGISEIEGRYAMQKSIGTATRRTTRERSFVHFLACKAGGCSGSAPGESGAESRSIE